MSAHFITRIEQGSAQDMCRANVPLIFDMEKRFKDFVKIQPGTTLDILPRSGYLLPETMVHTAYDYDRGQLLPGEGYMWVLIHRLEGTLTDPNLLENYMDIIPPGGNARAVMFIPDEAPERRPKVVSLVESDTEEDRDDAAAAQELREAEINRTRVSIHSHASANVSINVAEELGEAPSPTHPLPMEVDVKHPSENNSDDAPSSAGSGFLVLDEPSQNLPRVVITPIPMPGTGSVITTTPTPRAGQNSPSTSIASVGQGPITLISPADGSGSLNLIKPTPVGPPPPRTSTPTPILTGPTGKRLTPEYVYLMKIASVPTTAPGTPTRTTPTITGISITGPLKTLLENPPKSIALHVGTRQPSFMDIPEDVPQDSRTPTVAIPTTAGFPIIIPSPLDSHAVVVTTPTTTPTTAISQASTQSSDTSQPPLVIDEPPPSSPKN